MAASAAPKPGSASDPLAALDSYCLRFLPVHLAEAGRAEDLFKLLLLRRGDDSNAWFSAKPDVFAYLADVGVGQALAARQADCAMAMSLGLIADSVRSTTELRGPEIEALVDRDLLSIQQAISICAAAEPGRYVSGMTRLLAKISAPQRDRYLQEIVATIGVPVRKSTIGRRGDERELPLAGAEHTAVIARLAVLPELSPRELEAIEHAAWLAGESYEGVEAAVTVAETLSGDWRARSLDRAWSVATGLHPFRGRPEAEALVAACAARGGDRQYLRDAIDLALSVLSNSTERLRFNDWARYQDVGLGRSVLMRLQVFTEPLGTLAPVLGARELTGIMRELVRRWDDASRFGLIALMPRIAELDLLDQVGQLWSQLDVPAVMAIGGLLAAGVRLDFRAEDVLPSLAKLQVPEPRTLCMLTLLPDLPPERRLTEIEKLLRGVEDLGQRSSFRVDVLRALVPIIRQLPARLRDRLIRRASRPGALVRSAEEVKALLDPLVDVWPMKLLQDLLNTTRQIGLHSGEIRAAHRVIKASRPGRKQPGLSSAAATEVLEFVTHLDDGDKAGTLVLLAPFLDDAALRAARGIAQGIGIARLRFESAVRLAAFEPQFGEDDMVAMVRQLGSVIGELDRLQQTIDLLASLIEPRHAPALRPVLAEMTRELSKDELLVLCPVSARISDAAYYDHVDRAIAGLAVWYGIDGSPRGKQFSKVSPLTLNMTAASGGLIREFSRRGDWATVRSLMTVLRTVAGRNDDVIAAAEFEIVNAQATGSAAAAAADRLVLLADLVRTAPSRSRRLRALAAALVAALSMPHSELATALIRDRAVRTGSARTIDLDLAAAMVAATDLRLARGDLAAAAAALNGLVTGREQYRMAQGRLASHTAASIARYLDGDDRPMAKVGEAAIDAYLDFLAAHPEDYSLQEAGGELLRQRVGAATAAGREIPPSWLSRLNALADADEPEEVLLHQMAVEAMCDAGAAQARVGRAGPAVELFGLAFDRWQRHRELDECTRYLTDAAQRAASDLVAAGEPSAGARLTELATAAGTESACS